MAVYLFRVNWQWDTNFVQGGDRIVWGFHVDAPSAPGALALGTDFEAAMLQIGPLGTVTLQSRIPEELSVESYQVYDVVNGGPPVDEALPVAPFAGTSSTPGPTEVQVVVSRWVNDGLGRPFKKGRIYIGPLGTTATGATRPPLSLQQAVLDFSTELHTRMVADGMTPVVDTKGALHVPETIVQYSADDAWDTQRRRGLDPTSEIVAVP